jgi:flagellar protein FlaG
VTALPQASKAPSTAKAAIQIPEKPNVQVPKPVDIHFDPSELQKNLQDMVHMLNQQINANNRGLGFQVDQAIDGPVVTVRSSDTGEVVRQIPSETVVEIAHNIERMKGLLFNAKT